MNIESIINSPDLLVKSGSNLYGIATPESDTDWRGVVLPPLEACIGLQTNSFEQYEDPNQDKVIYSLGKFLKLCCGGSIACLEILFAPEYMSTELGEQLIGMRSDFISKRYFRSIRGFATAEQRRMQALNTVIDSGDEKTNQLLEQLISTFHLKRHERDLIIDIIEDSTEYRIKKLVKSTRLLGEKRRQLMNLYGYDVKAAANVVRLLSQGIELLTERTITFPRPEAPTLRSIRAGEYGINSVMGMIDTLEKELIELESRSDLSKNCDVDKINEWYTDMIVTKCKGFNKC